MRWIERVTIMALSVAVVILLVRQGDSPKRTSKRQPHTSSFTEDHESRFANMKQEMGREKRLGKTAA